MQYVLNLTRNNYVKAEPNEAFAVGVQEMRFSLNFEQPLKADESIVVVMSNGNDTEKKELAVPEFLVPENLLHEGRLNLTISALKNGKITRHWVVYPIIIMDSGIYIKHLEFKDWCDRMQKKIDDFVTEYANFKDELQMLSNEKDEKTNLSMQKTSEEAQKTKAEVEELRKKVHRIERQLEII